MRPLKRYRVSQVEKDLGKKTTFVAGPLQVGKTTLALSYRSWRNWLKGLDDGKPRAQRILVTGSARLDLYRRGGDSLQGRYHFLRLHPLSVAELGIKAAGELHSLMTLRGFLHLESTRLTGRRARARSRRGAFPAKSMPCPGPWTLT